MKRASLIVGLLLSAGLVSGQEETFPPAAFPSERYEAMARQSPFVLPSPEVEAPPPPTWVNDYRITSIIRSGGETTLLLRNLVTDERQTVTEEPNRAGIRLVELTLATDPRLVTATLERDGATGVVTYDEMILNQLPAPVGENNPALLPEASPDA